MARDRIITAEAMGPEEEPLNRVLRPERLNECIGSAEVMEKIRIAVAAARQRTEPLEHVLLHGPPGLGKTTLAHVIANEMGRKIRATSGPALRLPGDLMGVLTNLDRGDVLFIDEIHRLPIAVEEFLYPAMEEFKVDFTVDSGPHARTINLPLKPFTLVGATTRAGLLSAPFLSRFGMTLHLDFWSEEELLERVRRSSDILRAENEPAALRVIAQRSRGTPRIANRLLRRVRDYAQVRGKGRLTVPIVEEALLLEGVDQLGLDELDRKYLETLIRTYQGGPAGIEALAATLGEARDTLEDVVEPFLLRRGLVARTRQGRRATRAAYAHLGVAAPEPAAGEVQGPLFGDEEGDAAEQ